MLRIETRATLRRSFHLIRRDFPRATSLATTLVADNRTRTQQATVFLLEQTAVAIHYHTANSAAHSLFFNGERQNGIANTSATTRARFARRDVYYVAGLEAAAHVKRFTTFKQRLPRIRQRPSQRFSNLRLPATTNHSSRTERMIDSPLFARKVRQTALLFQEKFLAYGKRIDR